MVLMSRMQLDDITRKEMLLREVRRERLAQEAKAETVKAQGSPKVQSQFFMRRFGTLVARLKLQSV